MQIFLAGLIIQLISFAFFFTLFLRFLYRVHKHEDSIWRRDEDQPWYHDWRALAGAMVISCLGILVRRSVGEEMASILINFCSLVLRPVVYTGRSSSPADTPAGSPRRRNSSTCATSCRSSSHSSSTSLSGPAASFAKGSRALSRTWALLSCRKRRLRRAHLRI